MLIPSTIPTPSADPRTTVSGSASTNTSTTSADLNNLASEDTFLKLFVAQLQNQDPLNPNQQDPTQMVSELAQFSELEQLVNIGQNVQSIDQTVTSAGASGAGSSTGSAGTSGGNASAASGHVASPPVTH